VNMPWTTMDAAFVKSYIAFMGILVSAKTEFLSLVLASTIQRMTHHSGLNTLSASSRKPQWPLSLAAWSTTDFTISYSILSQSFLPSLPNSLPLFSATSPQTPSMHGPNHLYPQRTPTLGVLPSTHSTYSQRHRGTCPRNRRRDPNGD
jgi:hypothetical protein